MSFRPTQRGNRTLHVIAVLVAAICASLIVSLTYGYGDDPRPANPYTPTPSGQEAIDGVAPPGITISYGVNSLYVATSSRLNDRPNVTFILPLTEEDDRRLDEMLPQGKDIVRELAKIDEIEVIYLLEDGVVVDYKPGSSRDELLDQVTTIIGMYG